MPILFILLIICPKSDNQDVLNYLNSLNTEEEIYQSIKNCPMVFLVKEGISRLKKEEYLEKMLMEGDWYIKYLVIPKIKNQDLLEEIYLKESDKILKEEAIKFIKDQNFLKNSVKKDKNPFALPNIEDEIFLKEIALEYENEEIGEKALFFVQNPSILKNILRDLKNNDLIEIVFLKLAGTPYVKEIVLGNFSEEIKKKAIDYLDVETLKELVYREDFPFKKEGILKIKDQKFLMEFYKNTDNLDLKASCLENIKDEEFLKKIFLGFPELKGASLKNIEDETFIMENFDELSDALKERAINKIKNQEFLKKVFKESKKENLKELSIKKIFDNEFLKEAYKDINSRNIKKAILYNLNKGEQEFFKRVALQEKSKYLKAESLKFIEDDGFIRDIILKENSFYVKLEGLKRLSNQEILKDLFEGEKEWFVKVYVLEKIKNKDFLKDKELLEELSGEEEISKPIPYEEICVNLKEENFKGLEVLRNIVEDLGKDFEMDFKARCKERRYFNEEENLYPPLRGKSFQVIIKFEILNKSNNFYKKMEFSGRHLAKRENFDETGGKINGYYVKYYFPKISFLEFTREILKEFDLKKLKEYKKSKNKYIKAAALIEKSYLEAK